MMLDADVVAVSPSSVYRVLRDAGLLQRFNGKPSRKGTGFEQPLRPHEHWHVDVSYLNVCGTFYYLCSLLDGASRYIVHWEIRAQMTEADVEIIVQAAREKFPGACPRIISDNGPQFIAKDFKEFIRICGMTHVRTSPYYPQSNGKIERWHKSIKSECIRPGTPLSLEDARRIVGRYVEYYNTVRLHRAIGYVAPKDKLEGRAPIIWAERDRKLAEARDRRKTRRQAMREPLAGTPVVAVATTLEADRATLVAGAMSGDNDDQPVKRTRALQECNPPGIAGRVCDEWSRGRASPSASCPSHHSEHFPMPQKTQSNDCGGYSLCGEPAYSNSG
jgi:putative transposase